MPTFDFQCKQCGHKFEELVSLGRVDELRCPNCGSGELARVYEGRWQCGGTGGGGQCTGNCATCPGCGNH